MENKKLKTLALMGLAGGLLCAGEANAAGQTFGNTALNGTYGTLLAGGSCGGVAVGSDCGAKNAPEGQVVSVGCQARQISGNSQGCNSTARQQARQQGCSANIGQAGCANQQPQGQFQGQSLTQGCSSRIDPQAGQPSIIQGQQQQLSQGCGSSPKSSQNNNNNYYYADALKDDQNQDDKYQDSNSKHLAENEVRPGAKLVDPRLTDKDFHNQLSPQAKATFQSLSPEGKALAIKIANEDPAHDRNAAVKKAAEKMAEKRNGVLNRSMSH